MRLITNMFVVAVLSVIASGCVSTQTMETTNEFTKVEGPSRLLLIEPFVEASFIKASEVREVRADWTDAAKSNLLQQLEAQLTAKQVEMTTFDMDNATEREVQLVKLNEAVRDTIISNQYGVTPLPTKKDTFDYSLGPGVSVFAENHDADYALMFFARGEYASAGKVLANVVMAAAFGATGSTGGQQAYVSLVDLRSGDIVWFNIALTGAGTDMREPDGAARLVMNLLNGIPL